VYIVYIFIIAVLLVSIVNVNATVIKDLTDEERESGFYNEDGTPSGNRTAINPDFDPDEDCNIAYELKCIPGSEQDCPEGFHNGEDNVCSPVKCQEGYFSVDDDETGLCYSIKEGGEERCEKAKVEFPPYTGKQFSYIFLEDEQSCANPAYVCDDRPDLAECKEISEWRTSNSNSE
jgi:hypothetical protein